MNAASSLTMLHRPQLTLIDKSVTLGAWVLAGTLFMTVGWMAMEPDDPGGAVSILTRSGSIGMFVQAAALAGIAGAVATIMAGRRVPEAGTFAAAIGLAVVSLRGSTATQLLLSCADIPGISQRLLALKLAGETLVWFVIVLFAMFVSVQVGRWYFSADGRTPVTIGGTATRREGIRHTITTCMVGLLVMSLLSAGLHERSIQHGQVCFVIALSVAAGVYVAFRCGPVDSPLWSILAVPAIAVLGYLWAAIRPPSVGLPPNLPSSHFLRALPIQYVSVGTAAALVTYWYARRRGIGFPPPGRS